MVEKVAAQTHWTRVVDIPRVVLCHQCCLQVDFLLITYQHTNRYTSFHSRAFLTDEQRQNFGVVVVFFKENVDPLSKDLAFLLGGNTLKKRGQCPCVCLCFRVLREDSGVQVVVSVHAAALARQRGPPAARAGAV